MQKRLQKQRVLQNDPLRKHRNVCEKADPIQQISRNVATKWGIVGLLRFPGSSPVTVYKKRIILDHPECIKILALYDDVPLYWDAWDVMDYHMETRNIQNTLISPLKQMKSSELAGVLEFELKIGAKSSLKQRIVLR